MRWFLVLGLAACGRSGADLSSAPPEQSSGAVTAEAPPPPAGYGPWECSQTCERVKTQLVRDFGVPPPIHCWDWDLFTAGSASACSCAFERRWGVSIAGAPSDCAP